MSSLHSDWHANSAALAKWTERLLVNRNDVWGGYNDIEDRNEIVTFADGHTGPLGKTTTRPIVKKRGKSFLTMAILERHFRATRSHHVVGLHTTGADNMSRWGVIEIDRHEESTSAENNLAAALAWFERLRTLGFRPLLSDSDGKGGYHLMIVFSEPVPTMRVFHFLRWLTSDHIKLGLTQPETFPKQESIPADGYGNWLRLIGRHHTSDHWARVWNGNKFLEGVQAIDFVLGITGDSLSLIPTDAVPGPNPQTPNSQSKKKGSTPTEFQEEPAVIFPEYPEQNQEPPPQESPEHSLEVMLEAIQYLPNAPTIPYENSSRGPSWLGMGMAIHSADPTAEGLKVWEEWSAQCLEKHNKKCTCSEKWTSFGKFSGRRITIGSLIMWAKAKGYREPTSSTVTNYRWESKIVDRKEKHFRVGLSQQSIRAQITSVAGSWPKSTAGMLFVEGPDHEPYFLERPHQFFAWLADKLPKNKDNKLLWSNNDESLVSRAQYFEHERQVAERFDSVEGSPHFPPMPGHYYLHPKIHAGEGAHLSAFLDFFATQRPPTVNSCLPALRPWSGVARAVSDRRGYSLAPMAMKGAAAASAKPQPQRRSQS